MNSIQNWNYEDEWFEETNLNKKIKTYLEKKGYEICKFNEKKQAKGADLIASKNGNRLIFEVKGYPSDKYVRGPKKGEIKNTKPDTQARHWFAQAIFQLLIEKSKSNKSMIVLGLPEFEIYKNLFDKMKPMGKILDLKAYFVNDSGIVKIIN